MSLDTSILTVKDLKILEALLDRLPVRSDQFATVLRKKINSAQIVFPDDVPANVATLDSRVAFCINGQTPEARILVRDGAHHPMGASLSISTHRGLAMLGMSERQVVPCPRTDGSDEMIELEKILYQPEASRRELQTSPRVQSAPVGQPTLRLLQGGGHIHPRIDGIDPNRFDDPDPSAA